MWQTNRLLTERLSRQERFIGRLEEYLRFSGTKLTSEVDFKASEQTHGLCLHRRRCRQNLVSSITPFSLNFNTSSLKLVLLASSFEYRQTNIAQGELVHNPFICRKNSTRSKGVAKRKGAKFLCDEKQEFVTQRFFAHY